MARNFVVASSKKLTLARAICTATPLTMAFWWKPVSDGVVYGVMNISDGTVASSFSVQTTAAGTIRVGESNGGFAATSTTFSAGVWSHACGVFASDSSRSAYLNGGGKSTSTNARTVATLNQTKIGTLAGDTQFMDGDIAEAAIWNVALTDAEVSMLGVSKVSPLLIRPANLVAYWPLLGKSPFIEADVKFGLKQQMKVTGALPSQHPPYPFYRPVNRKRKYFTAVAESFRPPPGRILLNAVQRAASW